MRVKLTRAKSHNFCDPGLLAPLFKFTGLEYLNKTRELYISSFNIRLGFLLVCFIGKKPSQNIKAMEVPLQRSAKILYEELV